MATGVLFGKDTAPTNVTREQEEDQPLLRAARNNRTRPSNTQRDRHSGTPRERRTVVVTQASAPEEPVQIAQEQAQTAQPEIQTEQQRLAAFNLESFNPQQ